MNAYDLPSGEENKRRRDQVPEILLLLRIFPGKLNNERKIKFMGYKNNEVFSSIEINENNEFVKDLEAKISNPLNSVAEIVEFLKVNSI